MMIPTAVSESWLAAFVLQAFPWLEPYRSAIREARDISHVTVACFMRMRNEH